MTNYKPEVIKKIISVILLTVIAVLPIHAVLKEKDLSKTLGILKLELKDTYGNQKFMMQQYSHRSAAQHQKLVDFMKRADQISLILYSQKSDFTLDLAYACTEASNLYKELNKNNVPYEKIQKNIMGEVARYDSLITSLEELPPSTIKKQNHKKYLKDGLTEIKIDSIKGDTTFIKHKAPFTLSKEEQKDREECIMYAKAIRNNLLRILINIDKDHHYYKAVTNKVENLNNYTKQRYKDLQQSIFKDGTSNYLTILSQLPRQIPLIQKDVDFKYRPLGKGKKGKSEWRGPIILAVSIFMLVYIFIATILSNIFIRLIPYLLRKTKFSKKILHRLKNNRINFDPDTFKKYQRNTCVLALGVLIFAVALSIVKQNLSFNLFIMASNLMMTFSWLIEALLISLLIRLKAEQTRDGIRIYMPYLCMALIIIFFRIVLIPNNLVNLICPPILIGFTIWQFYAIRKSRQNLPLADLTYSSISFTVMVTASVCSLAGFTLMAVQIIIWWTFQLAAIQTITCVYDLLEIYEKNILTKKIIVSERTFSGRKELLLQKGNGVLIERIKKGQFIHKTWAYDFIIKTLIPIIALLSIITSIYMSADVFEMTAKCKEIFDHNYALKGFLEISIKKLGIIIECFFIFRYLNYVIRTVYQLYRTHKALEKGGGEFNETLARNIIAILVWGTYFIFTLKFLKVPPSGIEIVFAGLATGMGFAMKDLLENFFYGISLMTGRLRVGDYIECDGIQGKVESITYQSTQIITLDGSVIAFLNASLFNKNFKNLTRNHSYELVKIPIGVAYGSNIQKVRDVILKTITPLCQKKFDGRPIVSPDKTLGVIVSDFGDSSVDLQIRAWMLVDQKNAFTAEIRESVYTALNENDIEIPFPQRDIHIRSIANNESTIDINNIIK